MLLLLIIPILGTMLRSKSVMNAGLLLVLSYGLSYDVVINLGNWLEIGNLKIDWEIRIDKITHGILFPILLINFVVQLFSIGYMAGDPHITRYYLFLNFFVTTMILMVSADNFFVLFVGWEGVGLASYFLINFWFTRIYANLAGLKAFLFNRVGDWGLTLGLIFYYYIYGSLNLDLQYLPRTGVEWMGFAIILGAITKSAQIGLHSWLSRSMEGPTPVSALLHAATMVTAGVYLMLRMNIILWASDLALILCWIGGLSALAGAIGGLAEQDIKKIIAYSTISQLGYMFIALGFSEYNLSLWHLINHACFKALLFISAGALIHSLYGIQDIRKYGRAKFIAFAFLIGNLSIMAIPFMTGWWTKDQILLQVFYRNSYLFLLIYTAAIITAIYSIKLFISAFSSVPRLSLNYDARIDSTMLSGILLLSVAAVVLGYFTSAVDFFTPGHLIDPLLMNEDVFLLCMAISFILALALISGNHIIRVSFIPNVLLAIDLIYLRLLTNIIAPVSTYLFRNGEAGLHILLGGVGIVKLLDGLAFRLEILR